ncbi:MAG TPA: hydrolase [Gammaproteobacteria bacterium]|jgi:predicted alpha/beta-fold hydrolase
MPRASVEAGAFAPAWWLPGPHAQTLWPALLRRTPLPILDHEELNLPDGDFVDLHRTRGRGAIVALFHGLEGSLRSHYARGLIAAIAGAGWRCVFMHFRGCSGRHNRLPRSYHSGDTGDIAFLLRTLSEREPGTPLAAIGISLGGNALLKYLGEERVPGTLRAAAAVSVPFQLADGAARLDRGFSRLYQRHLLGRLRRKFRDKFRNGAPPVPIGDLDSLDNFRKFDGAITAPLHGFRDADDYYSRSSSRQFLGRICVPTLILQARDDPFLTPAALPRAGELSDCVRLELSRDGGHVGFVGGRWPWRPEYWLDRRIPDWFRDHLESGAR